LEPPALPGESLILFVDEEVRDAVRSGKFVHMIDVLPAPQRPVLDGKSSKDSTVLSFRLWVEAFGIFQELHRQYHPQDATGMAKYMSDLAARAARTEPTGAFYHYDVFFRRARAFAVENGWPLGDFFWGRLNQELWSRAILAARTATASQPARKPALPRSGGWGGICNAFNSADGCHFLQCKFRHQCARCQSTRHGAPACPPPAPSTSGRTD
jgi:hypothetical protein